MSFSNPVIPGFHPDPSVCRVGEDYYLACSSFEYVPGIPVFHSRDLVHWTQLGNVLLPGGPAALPADTPSSAGIYAPTLRHHDDRFWLIVTNVTGGGNMIFTTEDPTGPWSDPVLLPDVHGIDPDLAWDEDGTCWVTCAGVSQVPIDPVTGRTTGPQRATWSGSPGAQAPEAPHLYRIGEHWYLLISEGGTERGHSVAIARGRTATGPFEPCPSNPILTHRGTHHPIQNTGHADLVQGPDGSWWMVLLGVRPGGGTPGWHVLGRETFLVPVTWADGWPVVGDLELTMPDPPWPLRPSGRETGSGATVLDDFDGPSPGPQWVSLRQRPVDAVSTVERPGRLTLHAKGRSLDDLDVTFVGRRQQHLACRVRALVDAGEGRGGLSLRLDEDHHYDLEVDRGQVEVVARIGPLRTVVATHAVRPGPLVLRIDIDPPQTAWSPRLGPDTVTLGVEDDGPSAGAVPEFVPIAALDGKYLSTEVAGGFTGRVIGMYALEGAVEFDWFEYVPTGA